MARTEETSLHGHRVSYRIAGDEGPVILLIHGITGSSAQWEPVMDLLDSDFRLVAPDLLGHGESAKPRGDYSLGAYASGLRDLMASLDLPAATVIGHSLGGGVAMQFAYQFPERCERLGLVSSGGLGREVSPLLRAATLPGAEFVLPLIAANWSRSVGVAVSDALGRIGLRLGSDLAEVGRGYASLIDGEARAAFLHTLRAVIEPGGQRVSAVDRLYLAEEVPSLIVWGRRDPLIPVAHAHKAHGAIPGSRLEIFDRSGHFPQIEEPVRFAGVLADFMEETEPAEVDIALLGERLRA
ncbi:MAG: alpha/beta fold hydrolase [Thermoleophilaceae bacterium]